MIPFRSIMFRVKTLDSLAVLLSVSFAVTCVSAQGVPTASRGIAPTVYVLGTATATGLEANNLTGFPGGKNLAVTGGLNVDFYSIGPFRLGLEARGTYPVYNGKLTSERDIVGGARVSYETQTAHVLRPYLDAHFGRGQMNFDPPYLANNLLYKQTASNIYGGGGGVEWDLLDQFSLKVDAQAYHWSTPVVTGNSLWSGQASVGIAYRLFANRGPR